jgi:hypothetical protein
MVVVRSWPIGYWRRWPPSAILYKRAPTRKSRGNFPFLLNYAINYGKVSPRAPVRLNRIELGTQNSGDTHMGFLFRAILATGILLNAGTAWPQAIEVLRAATPLLKEIGKSVSISVLTTTANASFEKFLSTKPSPPTAFDKAKLKELLDASMSHSNESRSAAFASKVDYFSRGIQTREELASWAFIESQMGVVRIVEKIDLIEVDPNRNFAAVSYTTKTTWTDADFAPSDGENPAYVQHVALIGDYSSSPKIYGVKRND